jgi:hypothetical protein
VTDTYLASATRRAARAAAPTRVGAGKLIEAWLDLKFRNDETSPMSDGR